MWTLDAAGALPLWLPLEPAPRAIAAFTTRRGGVSRAPFDSLNLGRSTDDLPEAVAENRRRVLAGLGADPARLATAGQVHGARVVEVTAPGHTPACDALLTRVPGLVLAVTTADCMPVLVLAPDVIAVVHSGWRGTAAGMVRAAYDAVRAASAAADEIQVHVGPCIRACCYEVGPEVAERFPAAAVRPVEGARPRLDLALAARLELERAGLPAGAFHDLAECTACRPQFYYSHRRDGSPSGRQWALAGLRDASAPSGARV